MTQLAERILRSRPAISAYNSQAALPVGPQAAARPVKFELSPRKCLLQALCELPLFKRSRWERLSACSVLLLAGLFLGKRRPEASSVVNRMTLWERFLTNRCRRSRQMTIGVGFNQGALREESFIPKALAALTRIMTDRTKRWENQPLNVVVTSACRMRSQDPRKSVNDNFAVAVQQRDGSFQTCHLNLAVAADLSNDELDQYVQRQLAEAKPSVDAVSAVIDCYAVDPDHFGGGYAELPGAWLRLAMDKTTGGLVATADHLVLDGALFQSILFHIARATLGSQTSKTDVSDTTFPAAVGASSFATLRLPQMKSNSDIMKHIIGTLEESGLRLHQGLDTILLTTIQQSGSEGNEPIEKHQRRVLPLILGMEDKPGDDEIRRRVQKLNSDGSHSVGAFVWNWIYGEYAPKWLVFYFERIAHRIPFQHTARVLSGGAVVSFLPPADGSQICASEVSHLSCRTIGTTIGGPTIAVMQVRNDAECRSEAFITISGSGDWNDSGKINTFRNALAEKLSSKAG